jgi:hypothetical protein
MGTQKIKAIELVFDWNLWPRQAIEKLDATNLNRMKDSLRSGFALPPIVVNRKDLRIVDGFHRTTAALAVLGDEATIEAELRNYDNDAAMLLEAGTLNAYQGLTMGPKDRAHFYLKCRKMKIPPAAIAAALRIDEKKLKEFIAKRSAKTRDGEIIALPAGARGLAGLELTETQEHFARTANGCLPEMYASMLLNALRADAFMLNDRTIGRLRELRDEIDRILEAVA